MDLSSFCARQHAHGWTASMVSTATPQLLKQPGSQLGNYKFNQAQS